MESIQILGIDINQFRLIIREEVKTALNEMSAVKKRYYTRPEVADMLRVSLPTIHRLVNEGILEISKVGGRTLFDAEKVDEAIAEKKVFRYKHKDK